MAYAPPTTLDPTNVMGRRIAAWFIDVVIPSVAAAIVGYIVFIGAATKISGVPSDYCTFQSRASNTACIQVGDDAYIGSADDTRNAFTAGGLIVLVGAINLFVVQGLTGASAGKHMIGLRVVRADGSLVGFGWNALRTLFLVVDHFCGALVGLITALATHPHRRVGDFVAGTFVVAKESAGTPIAAATAGWPPPSPGTWTPPPPGGPTTWGPPPVATPTWGAPPATSPPAATEVSTEPPAADAPGWGAPAPSPAVQPAPLPAAQPAPQPASREPQWDAQRNAWVYWEAETSRWLQFDAASGQWGPLR